MIPRSAITRRKVLQAGAGFAAAATIGAPAILHAADDPGHADGMVDRREGAQQREGRSQLPRILRERGEHRGGAHAEEEHQHHGASAFGASVGGASLVLSGKLVIPPSGFASAFYPIMQLTIDIVAGTTATTGTIFTTWNLITDDETYSGSVRVFPTPIAYTSSDKLGNTAGLALFV